VSDRSARDVQRRATPNDSSASKSQSRRPPPPPPPPEPLVEPPPELPDDAAVTVSVTPLLFAVPVPFVAARRNWSPDIAVVIADTVSVPVVVPEYAPPSVRSVQVDDPEGARNRPPPPSGSRSRRP